MPTYNASHTNIVRIDADAAGGWTINLPAGQNGHWVEIYQTRRFPDAEITLNAQTGDTINLAVIPTAPAQTIVRRIKQSVSRFTYFASENEWVLTKYLQPSLFVEAWQATAESPMSGLIEWSFLQLDPDFPSPVLLSHSAGTLTFLETVDVDLRLMVEVAQVIGGNNQNIDEWTLTPATNSTGFFTFPRIIDGVATASRPSTVNASRSTDGVLEASVNDTLTLTAAVTSDAGSQVNLTAGVLLVGTR